MQLSLLMKTLIQSSSLKLIAVALFLASPTSAWAQKQTPWNSFSTSQYKQKSYYLEKFLENIEASQLQTYKNDIRVPSQTGFSLGAAFHFNTSKSSGWFSCQAYDSSKTVTQSMRPYSVLRVDVKESSTYEGSNFTSQLSSRRIEITVETIFHVTKTTSLEKTKGWWWTLSNKEEAKDYCGEHYASKSEQGVGAGIVIYLDNKDIPGFKPSSYVSLGKTAFSIEAFAQEIRKQLAQYGGHVSGWGISFIEISSADSNPAVKALSSSFFNDMQKVVSEFQDTGKNPGFAVSQSTFFSDTASQLSKIGLYAEKQKYQGTSNLRVVLKPLVFQ